MAVMNSFAEAAGMRWWDCDRKRQRGKASHEREEQQKSCGQAVHAFL
ncbi:MAG: hypothetical protein WCA99_12490 [Candidatus Sulfotelmatobacter sp.]